MASYPCGSLALCSWLSLRSLSLSLYSWRDSANNVLGMEFERIFRDNQVIFIHSFLLFLYIRSDPSRRGGGMKRRVDPLEGAPGERCSSGGCRLGQVITDFVL
jgi:hypothetical protein